MILTKVLIYFILMLWIWSQERNRNISKTCVFIFHHSIQHNETSGYTFLMKLIAQINISKSPSKSHQKVQTRVLFWMDFVFSLTHFSPMSHFFTSWKRQETYSFLTFSGGTGIWNWAKMGQSLTHQIWLI